MYTLANMPAHVAAASLGLPFQQAWLHYYNSMEKDGTAHDVCLALADAIIARKDTGFKPAMPEATALLPDALITTSEKAYQYIDSYEFESRQVSQEDAGYSAVGGTSTKACSNCRFFVSPARCTVVNGVIAPNGLSNMWQAEKVYEQTPLPVVIVGGLKETDPKVLDGAPPFTPPVTEASTSTGVSEDLTIKAGGFQEPGIFTKVARAFVDLVKGRDGYDPARGEGLFVTKQSDGRLRWVTRYSNAWEDRDGEILTEAAHKEYADWVNETKVYPELWLWHTKGTRFGQTDWVDFADGFALASGLVDEGKENVIQFLKGKDLGVSHGFFSAQNGNLVERYRTFEISVLPRERAAVWTADFNIIGKETEMAGLDPARRKWLVEALGETEVVSLEKNTAALGAQLKSLGVDYKTTVEAEAKDEQLTELAQVNLGLKAVTAQVAELAGALPQILEVMVKMRTDLDAKTKDVTEQVDVQVSDSFMAQFNAAVAKAGVTPSATSAKSNVITDEQVKELGVPIGAPSGDFFADMITQQLTPLVGAAAAGGVGTPAAGRIQ